MMELETEEILFSHAYTAKGTLQGGPVTDVCS